MTDKDTVKFTVPSDDKENMRRILRNVYEALTEKGYNPVNQIVGYLLTEDPTYIHQLQQRPEHDLQDRPGRADAGAGARVPLREGSPIT